MELPQTMRAWQVRLRGSPTAPGTLILNDSVPFPLKLNSQPGPNTLLIRVAYAALNPADAYFMGLLPTFLPWRTRPVPCFDFVGTIVKAGSAAPIQLKEGELVCGAFAPPDVFLGKGALSEYVKIPADRVALVPDVLKGRGRLREAAGLGVAAQTAVLMLESAGLVKENSKGKRALVIGASGGVATLLVQILTAWDIRVVGICSGGNAEFVKGLGVAEASPPSLTRATRTQHH
jgi:NADPH:quinone reductase-like Zn-dependent oxidoreductase